MTSPLSSPRSPRKTATDPHSDHTHDERKKQADALRKKMREKRSEISARSAILKNKGKRFIYNVLIGAGTSSEKELLVEENAFFCLKIRHPFRQFIIRLVNNQWFDHFILLLIIINTVLLGLSDYSQVDENNNLLLTSKWNRAQHDSNSFFVIMFTIELVFKVIAMGFVGRCGSYLSDPWNYLDCSVVVTGLITVLNVEVPSIAVIRTFRVLRPLRSLRMVPGLKSIVNSIMGAIPDMGGVFSLVLFLMVVFAITGMQVFGSASSHARCRLTPYPVNTSWVPSLKVDYAAYKCLDAPNFDTIEEEPTMSQSSSPWSTPIAHCYWPVDLNIQRFCNLNDDKGGYCKDVQGRWCGSNFDALGNQRFRTSDSVSYGNGFYVMNDRDIYIPALNFGYTNFDSFGPALFTVFQAITQEGWTGIMYNLQDAYGKGPVAAYFCVLILFGCFFVLQLLLVVLEENFHAASSAEKVTQADKAKEKMRREAAEAEIVIKSHSLIKLQDSPSLSLSVTCSPPEDESSSHKSGGGGDSSPSSETAKSPGQSSGVHTVNQKVDDRLQELEAAAGGEATSSPAGMEGDAISPGAASIGGYRLGKLSFGGQKTQSRVSSFSSETSRFSFDGRRSFASFASSVGSSFRGLSNVRKLLQVQEDNLHLVRLEHLELEDFIGPDMVDTLIYGIRDAKVAILSFISNTWQSLKNAVIPPAGDHEDSSKPSAIFRRRLAAAKDISWNLVDSSLFNKLSGLVILMNCITLMSDHYPIDDSVSNGLDCTNALLTFFFAIELFLKVFGRGFGQYSKDLFSLFDALVVVVSMVDIGLNPPVAFTNGVQSDSGLGNASSFISILRCFRLFRIIKLAVRVGSIKLLLERVFATFLELGNYMLLLLIFLVIYTIVGMQFFANLFHFDKNGNPITSYGTPEWVNAYEIDRYNFNDFNSAFASVFQVMTTENWNVIAYDLWRAVGPWGVIFPCSIIIIGTFILMNLFLAILLNNFEQKSENQQTSLISPEDWSTSTKVNLAKTGIAQNTQRSLLAGLDMTFELQRQNMVEFMNTYQQRLRGFSFSKWNVPVTPLAAGNPEEGSSLVILPESIKEEEEDDDDEQEKVSFVIEARPAEALEALPSGDEGVSEKDLRQKKAEKMDQPVPLRFPAHASSQSFKMKRPPPLKRMSVARPSVVTSKTVVADMEASTKLVVEAKDVDRLVRGFSYRLFSSSQEKIDATADANKYNGYFGKLSLQATHFLNSLFPKQESSGDEQREPANAFFPLNEAKALGLFPATSAFRIFAAKVLGDSRFENFILVLIAVSSICLVVDSPLLDPASGTAVVLTVIEYFCTISFTAEMALKMVVLGCVGNPGSYFRGGWNALDGMICIISLIGLSGSNNSLKALKSLRSFRALRPLRVISRAPGLRTVVNSLISAVPDVINVFGVVLVVMSIFAVISVTFLKGDMRSCQSDVITPLLAANNTYHRVLTYPKSWNDMSLVEKSAFGPNSLAVSFTSCSVWPAQPCCSELRELTNSFKPTSREICECWKGSWSPSAKMTFDNFPLALMAFFSISTTENWVDLMYAAVDSAGVDMQPIINNNQGFVYMFVAFIVIGNFFALNLFIGVIIDNFEKVKLELQGSMVFLDLKDIEWIKMQVMLRKYSPMRKLYRPKTWLGNLCFDIQNNQHFEQAILFVIIANTIILAADSWGANDDIRNAFTTANMTFTVIFGVEMIIKVWGLGFQYLDSMWNWFDGLVTVGSIIGLLAFSVFGSSSGLIVTVVRVFRVMRVMRMIEGMGQAKRLIDTLLITLPGIFNIACLLLLAVFIYAILGMQLFAKVQYNNQYSSYANFRTFDMSLLTLIRFATGEAWDTFMYDAAFAQGGCDPDPEYDPNMCGFEDKPGCAPLNGCGTVGIFPFLLSYTLVVTMVMFNLFVSVIIEGFQEANEGDRKLIKKSTVTEFTTLWSDYDPDATCMLDMADLEKFLQHLPPPLGPENMTPAELRSFINKLSLSLYLSHTSTSVKVHYKDVLVNLSTMATVRKHGNPIPDHLHRHLDFTMDATYFTTVASPYVLYKDHSGYDVYTTREYFAARIVQRSYMRRLLRTGWLRSHRNRLQRRQSVPVHAIAAVDAMAEQGTVARIPDMGGSKAAELAKAPNSIEPWTPKKSTAGRASPAPDDSPAAKEELESMLTMMSDYGKSKAQAAARNQKLKELALNPGEISLGHGIGEGGFSVVYAGTFHNKQVAIKVIKRKDGNMLNKGEKEAVENELLMTRYLADPNIIHCYGFAHELDKTLVVLEFAPYGSLWDILREEDAFPSFPFALSVGWIKDLCSAVSHMFGKGVKHKDVKSENLLVYAYPDRLIAKLCDFGFARQSSATMSTSGGGTANFEAPEVRSTGVTYFASDIFSVGMTAVQILTRATPGRLGWSDQVVRAVALSFEATKPANPRAHESLQALLLQMTDVVADKRPDAANCAVAMSSILEMLGGDPRTEQSSPEFELVEAIEERIKRKREQSRARAKLQSSKMPGTGAGAGDVATSGVNANSYSATAAVSGATSNGSKSDGLV